MQMKTIVCGGPKVLVFWLRLVELIGALRWLWNCPQSTDLNQRLLQVQLCHRSYWILRVCRHLCMYTRYKDSHCFGQYGASISFQASPTMHKDG
ncbi:hypothetical protein D5086_002944 [Populus alba]|uniref:Uncharacterized protein n=1 Tax=Populus alba TaxID=43335 RepID=A0ACC4D3H5_POPAL